MGSDVKASGNIWRQNKNNIFVRPLVQPAPLHLQEKTAVFSSLSWTVSSDWWHTCAERYDDLTGIWGGRDFLPSFSGEGQSRRHEQREMTSERRRRQRLRGRCGNWS